MNILLDTIQRFVKNNGFVCRIDHETGVIVILIPIGNESGIWENEEISVSTIEQAREALGY